MRVQPGQPGPARRRPARPTPAPPRPAAPPRTSRWPSPWTAPRWSPPPICGLTRIPSGERLAADRMRASRRASSCGLSALTAMPSARASRSSAGVFAGESSTVARRRHPGRPRQRQLAGARHLRADALLAQQPQHRHQRGRLHREGVQHRRAGRGDLVEGRAQRRGRLPDAGDVEQADDGGVRPQQALLHGGAHRLVPARRPVRRRWLPYSSTTSPRCRSCSGPRLWHVQPNIRGARPADATDVLTRSIQTARM